LLFVVPVAGTTTAIIYDVGYFWGLDIKAFTLFALSEHIVFALEAIPIALGVAAYGFLLLASGKIEEKSSAEELRKLEKTIPQLQDRYELLMKRLVQLRRRGLIYASLTLVCGVISFIAGSFAIGIAAAFAFLLELSSRSTSDVLATTPTKYLFVMLAAFTVTFATGYEMQDRDRKRPKATHELVLQDGEIAGVLIRSGERGLLFVRTDNKQLSFIKWDQIKRVQSVVAERQR